ncbi:MAG: hypothetical protein E6Q32_06295 [Neisseriales bacterium]|jgi:hypothetical protein|nr:MAG: hypothetical protein E6Q32_06295 [Neisseriales bacterium]
MILFIKFAASVVALTALLRALLKCSHFGYKILCKLVKFFSQKQQSPVDELCHCGSSHNL